MATLYTANRVKVSVYGDDHLPPHFHLRSVEAEALFLIADLSVYSGSVPASVKDNVWSWVEENRATIAGEWNRLNPRFPIA